MPRSTLTSLREIANNITDSKDVNANMIALTKAFKLFSKETKRLEEAYSTLQKKFLCVDLELKVTNKKLQHKVLELDTVTDHLQNIVNNISQGMLFVDSEGTITTYNPSAENILHKQSSDIILHSFWDNFKDGVFGFSMHEAIAKKQAPEHALITLDVDADTKELEIDVSFVEHGIIVLIRDVTRVRRLQKAANRNNRMKELGEMAASVAHEIRNPLGGIEGYAALLQRDLKEDPHLHDMALAIVTGARSLNKLVSDVLDYARPLQINLQNNDINDIIVEAVALTRADNLLSQSLKIITQLSTNPLKLHVDKELLKAAFLNLIVNAVQAMEGDKTLQIKLYNTKKHAVIEFTDSGKGISQKNLEKIFSPFFTTKKEGSGIGLSEVHKIIRAHGGEIDVTSELNQGTTFRLLLPKT
jgi:signal transduction histidine kinase